MSSREFRASATSSFWDPRLAMRIWLDPHKLAARGLAASDVVQSCEQNVQVAAGRLGQAPGPLEPDFQLPINARGRLNDPKQFQSIVVKTGNKGEVTYLADLVSDDRDDQRGIELGHKTTTSTATWTASPPSRLPSFNSLDPTPWKPPANRGPRWPS